MRCDRLKEALLNFEQKIQELRAVAKGIFGTIDDINLFSLNFRTLDYVAEDERLFGLFIYLDASPRKRRSFVLKTNMKMTSIKKFRILKEAEITLKRLISQAEIIVLTSKFAQSIVLASKRLLNNFEWFCKK